MTGKRDKVPGRGKRAPADREDPGSEAYEELGKKGGRKVKELPEEDEDE